MHFRNNRKIDNKNIKTQIESRDRYIRTSLSAVNMLILSSVAILAAPSSTPLSSLPPLTPTNIRPIPSDGKIMSPPVMLPSPAIASANSNDVTYESGPAQYIDNLKRWQMTGGVHFIQNDTHLEMDSSLVNLDKDMNASDAKSLSPVRLYDKQNDLTGENGYVDFKTHEATITGHVMLIARPGEKEKTSSKESVRSQFKDAATLTCEKILYNYKRKKANIPGSLTIYQKDRTITADHGEYDGYAKTVTLIGSVHATDKNGNIINAPKLVAGIQEDKEWIYIPGRIQGKLPVKKDNTKEETHSEPEQPPAMPPIPETPPTQTGTTPADNASKDLNDKSDSGGKQDVKGESSH